MNESEGESQQVALYTETAVFEQNRNEGVPEEENSRFVVVNERNVAVHISEVGHVLAGNTITVSADNATGSRVAGVWVEQNYYAGSGPPIDSREADSRSYLLKSRKSLSILYGMEEAWLVPMPWKDYYKLSAGEYFVQIEMEVFNQSGTLLRSKSSTISSLLCPLTPGVGPARARHVLIKGDAGYGKSTLCTKIGYDWANDHTTFPSLPSESTFLVLYRLRDLPEDGDLETELIKFITASNSMKDADDTKTADALLSYSGDILLILDGYDEARPKHQQQVKQLLKFNHDGLQSVFRCALKIVTSRLNTDKYLHFLFDSHFRLNGLSEENTRSLAGKILNTEEDELDKFCDLLQTFNTSGNVSLPPILILMMCYLQSEDQANLVKSPVDIIIRVIYLLAKRCNVRDGFRLENSSIWIKLDKLGQVFFRNLKENRIVMTEGSLRQELQEDYDFLTKCGMLKKNFTITKTSEGLFEPMHKLLMEHLALKHLNTK